MIQKILKKEDQICFFVFLFIYLLFFFKSNENITHIKIFKKNSILNFQCSIVFLFIYLFFFIDQ